MGAILSHEQDDGTVHPVAYALCSVDKHERNYGISELETLGLVWAVRYFRPYILGHLCLVYIDHIACLSILNTTRPSGKLARWALIIQEMDLTKSGKKNTNADALSCCPADEVNISAVEQRENNEMSCLPEFEDISWYQMEDDDLSTMISYLREGRLREEECKTRFIVLEGKHFEVVENVLYHESPAFPGLWCVVVPTKLRVSLLEEAHKGRFADHLSELLSTYYRPLTTQGNCYMWLYLWTI